MNWLDKLDSVEFKIKTGDGKVYSPFWISGEKTKSFNYSKFEFINKSGSLIDRKESIGNSFPLVFYFQGEDNIEQAKAFDVSSEDKRAWTITHPFYGNITGQPTSIKYSDTYFNTTQVNVEFWESISDIYPIASISVKDDISNKLDLLKELSIVSYSSSINPNSSDISNVKESIELTSGGLIDLNDSVSFLNILETTLNAANNLIEDPTSFISNALVLISIPSNGSASILDKISLAESAWLNLKSIVNGRNDKFYIESQGVVLLSSLALSLLDPINDDFISRSDVEFVSNKLQELFSDFLITIDGFTVPISDTENSWSANAGLQFKLLEIVTSVVKGLFMVAFDAKQERIVENSSDSNLVVLAHKYMGPLDVDDSVIELFRKVNNIINDEVFLVKKGRSLKYYV